MPRFFSAPFLSIGAVPCTCLGMLAGQCSDQLAALSGADGWMPFAACHTSCNVSLELGRRLDPVGPALMTSPVAVATGRSDVLRRILPTILSSEQMFSRALQLPEQCSSARR